MVMTMLASEDVFHLTMTKLCGLHLHLQVWLRSTITL